MKSMKYRLPRHLFTTATAVLIGLYLSTPSLAAVAEQSSDKKPLVASAEAGQQKSATCQGCHGVDGNSYASNWPNLAAQHSLYISKQIIDFQTGDRKDPTMTNMVSGLSAQDIADIAAYFSQQVIVSDTSAKQDSTLIALGKKIYKGGNVYSGVPACGSCHGPNGVGNSPANFPALAGQKIDYVIKTLQDFRNSSRNNDPRSIMQNIATTLTDNEMKSVANYIYTLPATKTVSVSK